MQDLGLRRLPHTPGHALRLYGLPLHHKDPFDRMLISVALVEGTPIMTSDREFEKYSNLGLKVILSD